MKLLERLLIKLITPERIVALVASLIVKLLKWARSKNEWDKGLEIVKAVNHLTALFMDIYNDDALTEEDEEKIRNEIQKIADEDTLTAILEKVASLQK